MIRYHDREWGRPTQDDRRLFEFLVLEGAQAGLAWETILRKRDGYRKAFAGFDARKVARFTSASIRRLIGDPSIVRHCGKIESAVKNAKAFNEVQTEFGSFAKFLRSRRNASPEELSRDLKSRGFTFVGPTICEAYMQAIGMLDHHEPRCWRYKKRGRP